MKYRNLLNIYFLINIFNVIFASQDGAPFDIPQSPLLTRRGSLTHLSNLQLFPRLNTDESQEQARAPDLDRPTSACVAKDRLSSVTPAGTPQPRDFTYQTPPSPLGRPSSTQHIRRTQGSRPSLNSGAKLEENDEELNKAPQSNLQENNKNTNIENHSLAKPILTIITIMVVSFSILYKTNKSFYNKVNYYWEKIKVKIKYISNKDTNQKNNEKCKKVILSNSTAF